MVRPGSDSRIKRRTAATPALNNRIPCRPQNGPRLVGRGDVMGGGDAGGFSQTVILGRAAKRRRPEYPAVGTLRACGWTPAAKARAPGLHAAPGSPKGRGDERRAGAVLLWFVYQ